MYIVNAAGKRFTVKRKLLESSHLNIIKHSALWRIMPNYSGQPIYKVLIQYLIGKVYVSSIIYNCLPWIFCFHQKNCNLPLFLSNLAILFISTSYIYSQLSFQISTSRFVNLTNVMTHNISLKPFNDEKIKSEMIRELQ